MRSFKYRLNRFLNSPRRRQVSTAMRVCALNKSASFRSVDADHDSVNERRNGGRDFLVPFEERATQLPAEGISRCTSNEYLLKFSRFMFGVGCWSIRKRMLAYE